MRIELRLLRAFCASDELKSGLSTCYVSGGRSVRSLEVAPVQQQRARGAGLALQQERHVALVDALEARPQRQLPTPGLPKERDASSRAQGGRGWRGVARATHVCGGGAARAGCGRVAGRRGPVQARPLPGPDGLQRRQVGLALPQLLQLGPLHLLRLRLQLGLLRVLVLRARLGRPQEHLPLRVLASFLVDAVQLLEESQLTLHVLRGLVAAVRL